MKPREEYEKILKENFHLSHFYDTQWKVIKGLLNGERILFIARTGYGKSLCYQFPAILFDGLTIVFTPLIALMRDQVKNLKKLGIPAASIYHTLSREEKNKIIDLAINNKLKLLYIAPERQENSEWIKVSKGLQISMVVIDEAHCVSTWGHDFRPAYRRIINLVNLLPDNFPVLATTATATIRVQNDISKQVKGNLKIIKGELKRDNFYLKVVKVNNNEEKMVWLAENIPRLKGTGLIYTGTRVESIIFYEWLKFIGIPVVFYNAGLSKEERVKIEKGLMTNKWKCCVSTNALGMGIDKPDIRFIVHTQIPQSPIHYYQEIGRAGRDNKDTQIVLLYNRNNDLELPKSFIENARPPEFKYQKVIDILKEESLRFNDILIKANLNQTKLRVILNDLIDQNIIIKNKNYYEYRYNAPLLNFEVFNAIKSIKYKELEKMIEYCETSECRMKFLCNFLNDNYSEKCNKCDNDLNINERVRVTEYWRQKITSFKENYYPVLEVQNKNIPYLKNGFASAYYGFSNVGTIIHKCKYEGKGDFPDSLLDLVEKVFRKKLIHYKFDLIVFVPPTVSGNLVKNFAIKLGNRTGIPVTDALLKKRDTEPQKNLESRITKKYNLKDAFFLSDENIVKEKNILLFDDVFDSGKTIEEIGKYLCKCGAKTVVPLTIAKTISGR